jgi:O-antigen/teichoic acid export membrane protein
MLSALPAYLAMSDIGFGTAAANEMTIKVAEGDRDGALEAFQSTWLFITGVSLSAVVIGTAVVWTGPVDQWLNLSQMHQAEVAATLTMLLLHVAITLQGGLIAAGFRCEGLYAKETFLSNLLRLTESSVFILAVFFGARPAQATLVFLLVRCVGTVTIRRYLIRVAPWVVFGAQHAKQKAIKDLAGPALAFMAYPLGNAMTVQGMVIAAGAMLSPATVVVLTTVRTVTNVVRQAIGIVTLSVWPELSVAYGAGNMELARRLHRYACQASFLFAAGSAAVLLFGGRWLIHVWTRGAVEVDATFFRLMLLVVVVNTLWFTSSVVPGAINKHQRMAVYFVLGSAMSLVLALVALPTWGLAGIPVALLITDILMTSVVLRNSLALLNDGIGEFFKSLVTLPRLHGWKEPLPKKP